MARQIAILHGWGDKSGSFRKLESFLAAAGYDITRIWLGDYISTDDDVRIDDVARRMQAVIVELQQKGELGEHFDLIGHSTAGLVMREWAATFYPDGKDCPVQRMLMLAPANFGSRLATLGNSYVGRATKGLFNGFQTGREMLNALELGSPYQRDLVTRDLLDPEGATSGPYGPDGIWPFVITGSRGYRSITRRLLNEDGSDGTVRVPAANMNVTGLTVAFGEDAERPDITAWASRIGGSTIPFAVLPDRDHTQIKFPGDPSGAIPELSDRLGALILEALACDGWDAHQHIAEKWREVSEETAELAQRSRRRGLFRSNPPEDQEMHRYIQIVTRVHDDQGLPVNDYFIEFFAPGAKNDLSLIRFQKEALDDVHVNKLDGSVRCFYIDRDDLLSRYYTRGVSQLAASIVAANPGRNIRYFDKEVDGAGGQLMIHCEKESDRADLEARLNRNATHFVDIIIPRKTLDRIFALKRYNPG
jgi:pimeloyl-ACP methyl ester carboxylesterase